METLEAVEIVQHCQCCLKTLETKIDNASMSCRQLQLIFEDLFRKDLCDGLICNRCRTHLERFHNFKTEILIARSSEHLNLEPIEVKPKILSVPEIIEEFLDPPFTEDFDPHKIGLKDELKKLRPSRQFLSLKCDSMIKHFKSHERLEPFISEELAQFCNQENIKQERKIRETKLDDSGQKGKLNLLMKKFNVQYVDESEAVKDLITKTTKIYCPFCQKIMRALSFPTHLQLHQGKKLYNFMCEICSKKYVSNAELIVHQRSHNKEKPFKCDLCPRKFFTCKKNIIRHFQTIHLKLKKRESIPEKCELCDKIFQSSYLLRSHVMKVHPNGIFDGLKVDSKTGQYHCETCGSQYKTKHHFDNHVCLTGANDEENQSSCLICFSHCKSRADTLQHIQNVHAKRIDDKKWKCLVCNSIVLEKIVLHIESVHTTKNSKCSFCNKELKNRRCLRNHIYVVHENGSEIRKQKRKSKKILMKIEKR